MSRNKTMHEECPFCHSSLKGEEIPFEEREAFGGITHFSRLIGIEIPRKYDGVLAWKCPDCLHTWDRAPEPTQPGVYRTHPVVAEWRL